MMVGFEPSARPSTLTPQQVAREFRRLIDSGTPMRCAGDARDNPEILLSSGYTPKYRADLFDTRYYLTNVRQNPDIRFYRTERVEIYPRIFYKDISLIWRSASHFVRSEGENWIGKGEMRTYVIDGEEIEQSVEETTDLPLEIQTALETLSRKARRVPFDDVAIALVLRRGHDDRIEPYRDFLEPRVRARSDPRNLINRGRSIARFTRKNDPTSLRFAKGFEPDFERGIIEVSTSKSKLYGGSLKRFRMLSKNRKIQYLFFAGCDRRRRPVYSRLRISFPRRFRRPPGVREPDSRRLRGGSQRIRPVQSRRFAVAGSNSRDPRIQAQDPEGSSIGKRSHRCSARVRERVAAMASESPLPSKFPVPYPRKTDERF